jgi:hypothetical protein
VDDLQMKNEQGWEFPPLLFLQEKGICDHGAAENVKAASQRVQHYWRQVPVNANPFRCVGRGQTKARTRKLLIDLNSGSDTPGEESKTAANQQLQENQFRSFHDRTAIADSLF